MHLEPGIVIEIDSETLNMVVFWNMNHSTGSHPNFDAEPCNRNRIEILICYGPVLNLTGLHP